MSERRRRTMGERGAPPDPLSNIRYGQSCDCGRYCDCPDGFTQDWKDPWAEQNWDGGETQTPEPEPSTEDDSKGFTASDLAAASAFVASAGVLVGTLGVVGVPIVAAIGIGGFAAGHWFSKK